ncbi:MAG TPA: branched-chain amino acid ABC transporter ATP-binding protein, partial [Pusillimonas sp.]|nr:branched-chain amino acid ABC transporter ATP-binding protein [Pusillimonas sp.]
MASVLEATDVSGGYGEIQILKQVSVSLESGKVTAFVGT